MGACSSTPTTTSADVRIEVEESFATERAQLQATTPARPPGPAAADAAAPTKPTHAKYLELERRWATGQDAKLPQDLSIDIAKAAVAQIGPLSIALHREQEQVQMLEESLKHAKKAKLDLSYTSKIEYQLNQHKDAVRKASTRLESAMQNLRKVSPLSTSPWEPQAGPMGPRAHWDPTALACRCSSARRPTSRAASPTTVMPTAPP